MSYRSITVVLLGILEQIMITTKVIFYTSDIFFPLGNVMLCFWEKNLVAACSRYRQ